MKSGNKTRTRQPEDNSLLVCYRDGQERFPDFKLLGGVSQFYGVLCNRDLLRPEAGLIRHPQLPYHGPTISELTSVSAARAGGIRGSLGDAAVRRMSCTVFHRRVDRRCCRTMHHRRSERCISTTNKPCRGQHGRHLIPVRSCRHGQRGNCHTVPASDADTYTSRKPLYALDAARLFLSMPLFVPLPPFLPSNPGRPFLPSLDLGL